VASTARLLWGSIDAKGKVSWRTEVTQCGPGAKTKPNKGSSGRTPEADTYFGNGCKTDILQGKIENAYMSRCFLKRTHAAVLPAVQLTIRIGGW